MREAPRPADDAARVASLRRLGILDTPPEERFDRIVRTVARLFDAPIALVSLVDAERQWFKAQVGLTERELPRGTSFCGHVVAQTEPLVVPDATRDVRFFDNPLVTGAPEIRFYAGAQVHALDGHALGALCVIDSRPRVLTPEERQLLVDLAAWAELEVNAVELAEARRALEHERRFFEMSVDLVGISAMDGFFRRVNPAWTRATGHEAEALIARPIVEFLHPDDVGSFTREVGGKLAQGKEVRRAATRFRRADGSYLALEWSAAPLSDEGLVYSISRDVTAEKALEAERKRLAQLQASFVSTVSHELRTPLTSILGSLGLIAGGVAGEMAPRARALVDVARANGERLLRLVNDLLDVQKIEAGGQVVVQRDEDLVGLVRGAVEANQGFADRHGVRLVAHLGETPVRVRADRDRVAQVIANLASNAIKFTPRGLDVDFAVAVAGGAARVSIRDRGPGVPPAFRAQLFQKFAQAEGAPRGTGLGLAIARGLVEQHGGRVGFEDAAGGGTVFWFELPLAE